MAHGVPVSNGNIHIVKDNSSLYITVSILKCKVALRIVRHGDWTSNRT